MKKLNSMDYVRKIVVIFVAVKENEADNTTYTHDSFEKVFYFA